MKMTRDKLEAAIWEIPTPTGSKFTGTLQVSLENHEMVPGTMTVLFREPDGTTLTWYDVDVREGKRMEETSPRDVASGRFGMWTRVILMESKLKF